MQIYIANPTATVLYYILVHLDVVHKSTYSMCHEICCKYIVSNIVADIFNALHRQTVYF